MDKNIVENMILELSTMKKVLGIMNQLSDILNNINNRLKNLEKNYGCCCPDLERVEKDLKETNTMFASWKCPIHGRITVG